MYKNLDKSTGNKTKIAADDFSQKKNRTISPARFADNRPVAAAQKNLTGEMNRSRQKTRLENFRETDRAESQSKEIAFGSAQPLQRVILFENEQYNRSEFFANTRVFNAVMAKKGSLSMGELSRMANADKVYDSNNKFAVVDAAVIKSPGEIRNELGEASSTETLLDKRTADYPAARTLYAPINRAVIVINDGQFQFVGTSGLIGCVEVMIEYRTETDRGYLAAHVSSDIDSDETEIKRQLTVMLDALSNHLNKKIKWSDFEKDSPSNRLTLVRSAKLGEQKLLINMRNILAESGARMSLVNSNSATMEITATGAKYYDNQPDGLRAPPKTDYRDAPGYPFPE